MHGQPPVPMNTPALVGFISSVVICIPLLTQLLGLALGIAGIVGTSGRRTRGRGLAIAAVIISLLVALVWLGVGAVTYTVMAGIARVVEDIEPLLAAEDAELPTVAARVREGVFSERLKLAVDENNVVAFVQAVRDAHGNLDRLEMSDPAWMPSPGTPGQMPLRLSAVFDGGNVGVTVTLGFNERFEPEVDNIQVGELVLTPEQ